MYDFDTVIERRGTASLKYDTMQAEKGRDDLMSLWVADMDFPVPQEVIDAIHTRADHGIFGYTIMTDDYRKTVCNWFRTNHNWDPDPRWLVPSPGIVFALNQAVLAFTDPGDPVLIMQPVYYPFEGAIRQNGRTVVNCEMRYQNGQYELDYDAIEEAIETNGIRLCLFCNPQNPTGRVFTEKELKRFSEICLRHDVLVVSDEIHCDFVWSNHPHIPYASLSEEAANHCVICTAPSKTFNLAGLQASNLFVPNDSLRRRLREQMLKNGFFGLNTFALTACQAAYEKGRPWLDELRAYLLENLSCLRESIAELAPAVRLVEPEGLYLIWLDCSGLGMTQQALEEFILSEAGLWLDEGSLFGQQSGQFTRINIACPRSILKEALGRLSDAVKEFIDKQKTV